MAASEALGKIGEPGAVPALIKLFKDSSKTARETAGTALVAIGKPSVGPLIDSFQDKDFVVRCNAARALAGMMSDYQTGRSLRRQSRRVAALIEALSYAARAR